MTVGAIVIELTGPAIVAIAVVCLVTAALWVTALVSVLSRADHFENGSQLVWTLVILLAGPVGAVLYFVLARGAPARDWEPIPDRRQRREAIADPWTESKTAL